MNVLYDRVPPFYESQGRKVENILSDNGREYCGRPMIHPYQIFLELSIKFYPSVEKLQKDLDQWLHQYNYERPHRGYRNMGRRPIETIEAGKVIKE